MAIFKCKMCGGELNIFEDSNICECEYCGTTQTVPTADNEKKMNLFNRANRLRANNEFDKAAGVYESIVAEFPEEAEAYWGLVLCKYGIEYVDDPATGKKVPTCHRSSFDSIMDDSNFEMVMEYADPVALDVYRREAKQSEEIRKGIIEVSSKEEPYDVFICYKETDLNGDRTVDSLMAQDTYDALTEKGYRVFFSRVTLEDKLGQEYEPYIFAALNSAKVMLAFGTDYKHYNAVWVKNEWSRYLQLIAKGEKKTLIPCYKDIDAYDIPKEFAKLQAQDMGKVGALQDLLRGIEKIIPLVKDKESTQTSNKGVGPTIDSLIERVEIFLGDRNWDSACEYCEKILDIEPKNAKAYVYKVCATYKVSSLNELINTEINFEEDPAFKNALRFADNKLKAELEQAVTQSGEYKKEQNKLREDERNNKLEKLSKVREVLSSANGLIGTNVFCEYDCDRVVALKADGYVVASGENKNKQCNVQGWDNIISIVCGRYNTAALKTNGTVVANGMGKKFPGRWNVENWKDIIAIDCGEDHIAGLKADGTVVAAKNKSYYAKEHDVDKWTDIVSIACGGCSTVGLKANGTVVVTGRLSEDSKIMKNVAKWTNIVSVICGALNLFGLKADGTVVVAGSLPGGKSAVEEWTDVVSIAYESGVLVGLKADGTVVATGRNDEGNRAVENWTDIISIACGYYNTLGLKADGTVMVTGFGTGYAEKISQWTDIVAIECMGHGYVGIRADGTVVSVGLLKTSGDDISNWKLFNDTDDLVTGIEARKRLIEQAAAERKVRLEREAAERKAQEERDAIVQRILEEKKEAERKALAERKAAEEKARLEREAAKEKLRAERRAQGVCQYCGGELKGLIGKKCVACGKPKDY